jgi:hypothetical protein
MIDAEKLIWLRQMAAALAEAGADDAALDTEAIVLAAEHAMRQIEARRERLYDVWFAMECWQIGATDKQFRAALAAYREGE